MNHQECYRLLGLTPASTWDEAHQAWRREVQKWHPDRFPDEPAQRARAAQHMQRLNEALARLEAYQRRHGRLPLEAQAPPADPVPEPPPRTAEPPPEPAAAPRPSRKRASWWPVGIIALLAATYTWLQHPASETHAPPDSRPPLPVPSARPPAEGASPAPSETLPKPPFERPLGTPGGDDATQATFTYGDPIGKVIEVQGVPSRTVGDIWFYGASEVHFRNGRVVRWYSSTDTPLHTRN